MATGAAAAAISVGDGRARASTTKTTGCGSHTSFRTGLSVSPHTEDMLDQGVTYRYRDRVARTAAELQQIYMECGSTEVFARIGSSRAVPVVVKGATQAQLQIYPVISMDPRIAHMGSRAALLGANTTDEQVRLFSNELQVTKATPPTLIVQAADDLLVDVNNSIVFFESLRHHDVPVEMTIFDKGEHGFFLLPRDRWESIIENWLERKGLTK
jgi:pimeloyl-ACP methyl ester carboxylesterase